MKRGESDHSLKEWGRLGQMYFYRFPEFGLALESGGGILQNERVGQADLGSSLWLGGLCTGC